MNQLFGRTATNRSGNLRGMGRSMNDYLVAWERFRDADAVASALGVDRKACRARLRQLGVLKPQGHNVVGKLPMPSRFRCPSCEQVGPAPVCRCGFTINATLAVECVGVEQGPLVVLSSPTSSTPSGAGDGAGADPLEH